MKSYKELHTFNVSIPLIVRDPDDNSFSGEKETGILFKVEAHDVAEITAILDKLFAKLLQSQ